MHSSCENPVSLGELNLLDDNDADMVAFLEKTNQAFDRINTIICRSGMDRNQSVHILNKVKSILQDK